MNNTKVTTLAKTVTKNEILIWEWQMKFAGISVQFTQPAEPRYKYS